MEHNEQQSKEKKAHHNHSCCDGDQRYRGHSHSGEYRNSSDPNISGKVRQQSRKTTTIALGILMVVSLGLIGFEVITRNEQQAADSAIQGSKSLMILSQEREKEGAGLISSLAPRWREKEDIDSVALKETNRIQGNKIKTLKRQLVESNQKLHDVKAHLFTKGDPSDRARLAEICQDLVEKERQIQDLSETLAQLENDKEQNIHKISDGWNRLSMRWLQ
jgi:hypothetical protein